MKYLLAASDMDGTLLNSEKTISEENIAAIHRAEAAGMVFTLSTGRALCGAAPYVRQIGCRAPLIIFNGAMIIRPDGEVLYRREMLPEDSMKVWRAGLDGGSTMIIWSQNRLYANELTDEVDAYVKRCEGVEFAVVGDAEIAEIARIGVTKLLLIDRADRTDALMPAIRSTLSENVRCFKSSPTYIEFVRDGVSKGDALIRLCGILGIPVSKSIGLGDEENDMELIRDAGLGVAMGNAVKLIRDMAGFIAPTNDNNGVGAVLDMAVRGEL